jgi:SPP1 gp7 family putative phage head morphogenesis protein
MSRESTIRLIRILRKVGIKNRRKKLPRQLPPNAIRLSYYQAIREYLVAARQLVLTEVLPLVAERDDAMNFDAGKKVTAAVERITKQFYAQTFHPKAVEALAESIAEKTDKFQKQEFCKQVRSAVGVDVFSAEPNLVPVTENFVAENVALIKSVPQTYFTDIEKTITRGVSAGERHEDIAKDLTDRFGVAENRAKLIARDQVGKFYGALNMERQTALGVEKYIWRTANDNRVRDEHATREGEVYSWDDPPDDGEPGMAINCRCYAEPDFSALLNPDSDSDSDSE